MAISSSSRTGASLIELAIYLLIAGLFIGMNLSPLMMQLRVAETSNAWHELKAIHKALRFYAQTHGKMPCPASLTLAKSDDAYGSPAEDCDDGTPPAGVTRIDNGSGEFVLSGAVPVHALGMSRDFLTDPWGNYYYYVVTEDHISLIDLDNEGIINVEDGNSNAITSSASFVVGTHGNSVKGATAQDTAAIQEACDATVLDGENCDFDDALFIDTSVNESPPNPADFYDDYILWATNGTIMQEQASVIYGGVDESGCSCGPTITCGMVIIGIDAGDRSGHSVASAGDVNGDGFDDVLIGARYGDAGGSNSGESYVVFGQAGGWAASLDLDSLDGSNGFRLDGVDAIDASGYSVASAGDVNGDGYDDMLIGAPAAHAGGVSRGESYVVFGQAGGWAASLDLDSLDGTNGFRLDGVDGRDHSGYSVASAGDVNGDGYDDVLIGAYRAGAGGSVIGESYVVFGQAGGWAASLDLDSLDGTNGFRLDGVGKYDHSGWSVASAGDVNGDGLDDILIGAPYGDAGGLNSGESYVVFGQAGGWAASLDLDSLDGSNGFRLDGVDIDDRSGYSVASAGDVNGDGFDDVLIGAYWAGAGGSRSGESYVVFGQAGGWAASLDLDSLDGSNGFRLDGIDVNDYSGYSVASAGDVNGDGFDDIVIGAYQGDAGGSNSGESYVVFGQAGGWAASLDLDSLDGTNGFRLDGIDVNDYSGYSVASAGDVNGDGYDDMLIGATLGDAGGSDSGESYLVFGSSADWSSTAGVIDLSDLSECE